MSIADIARLTFIRAKMEGLELDETWRCVVAVVLDEAAKAAAGELRGHKPAGYDLWPDVPAAIRALNN